MEKLFSRYVNRYLVGVYVNQGAHEQGVYHDLIIWGNTGPNKVKLLYFRSYTTNFPAYHGV